MRRLVPMTLAALILAVLWWAFRPDPVPVSTAIVGPADITVAIEEEGTARIREVYTVSAPIAGRLERIALHAGDPVVAGETVVAAIGPAAPQLLDARARAVAAANVEAAAAAVDLARAALREAEASAEFSRSEAARNAQLFDRSAVSRRALDAATLAAQSAEAAVASAVAALRVREQELESARAALDEGLGRTSPGACCQTITAPVSGQVLRVLTTSEQVVAPGTGLMQIGDPANLEIVTELLSRDAVRIAPGAPATILNWGGAPLPATVRRISPSAETRVSALGIDEQRVEVVLDLDPAVTEADRAGLGDGFRVLVRIGVWQGQGVTALPVAALFRDGPDWAVFTVEAGSARMARVTLGERDADHAQLLDGVAPGAEVILSPSDQVSEGVAVAPAPLSD